MSKSASPTSAGSAACPEPAPDDDALSLFAAARDAGPAIALRFGGRAYRYAELAERVRGLLRSGALDGPPGEARLLTGSNTLETVLEIYALLQTRRPALLLHPRLTAVERQALVEAMRRAGPVGDADAAFMIHSSGTTGQPRAAVLTRSALLASARASAANMGWQDGDCWLLAMPIARIGGLSILIRCLAARRCVALAPAFDAALLPRWLDEQRVTLVSLVPTMLAQVLDANPGWQPPAALRAVQLGGAAASPRLLQRAADRRLPIVITYGCTETCSQVTSTPYAQRFEAGRHGAGPPLPGVQLRINAGRIEVRGPMRMAGYLGEPALPPSAWFDTGDLGEIDTRGNLQLQARRSDLIITGGENVYPGEVERAIEACGGVREAAVFGLPDETWGQTVAAALVLDRPAPEAQALIAQLAQRLAPFKRPRRLWAVDALPQTGAGKPDHAALVALAAGAPVYWPSG